VCWVPIWSLHGERSWQMRGSLSIVHRVRGCSFTQRQPIPLDKEYATPQSETSANVALISSVILLPQALSKVLPYRFPKPTTPLLAQNRRIESHDDASDSAQYSQKQPFPSSAKGTLVYNPLPSTDHEISTNFSASLAAQCPADPAHCSAL
jgi:hypothetical protein